MNKREEILHEALWKNEEATTKWLNYTNDHKQAIENLDLFNKQLEIDIMVPIGKKALMPGKLCHTNEVLISHHSKMFSKCTAYQAKEICKRRIDIANNQLEKLIVEKELFKNKLEIPQNIGIVANNEEHEIIEEYNEENEAAWRERHRQNMKESKLKEKLNQIDDNNVNSHEDIMIMLDEREAMEELEKELHELNINDDNTLEKLMSGEIKINEKPRKSRVKSINDRNELNLVKVKNEINRYNDLIYNNEINDKSIDTNHYDSDSSSVSSVSSSDIPREIIEMEKEVEHDTVANQIAFYKKNIKNIEKELQTMKMTNPQDVEMKMNKIEIRDYLLDLITILKDDIDEKKIQQDTQSTDKTNKKTRRISFAAEDQVKYIDCKQKVTEMFQKSQKIPIERDVIKLDPEFELSHPYEEEKVKKNLKENKSNSIDKSKKLLEKVEKNIEFVHENQSQKDFDLIGQILEKRNSKTIKIKFKHSNSLPTHQLNISNNSAGDSVIGCPADFYTMFDESKYNDNQIVVEDIKKENGLESGVNVAYVDPRIEFSKPSILKNKELVKNELHIKNEENQPQKTQINYSTIIGDVIENPITEPDGLPEENFIDVHTPRKRISRFKKLRSTKAV